MTTPREQLALTIYATNHLALDWDDSYMLADAIIQAGWQPPIPDRPNTLTNN